jgi:hypothetical protein
MAQTRLKTHSKAATELREAFGLRGACFRFRAILGMGQRQPVLRSGTAEGGLRRVYKQVTPIFNVKM